MTGYEIEVLDRGYDRLTLVLACVNRMASAKSSSGISTEIFIVVICNHPNDLALRPRVASRNFATGCFIPDVTKQPELFGSRPVG
jgi:hypothetical protein